MKMNEQELYQFCIENVMNLIDGKLSIDKIIKLREINFSFDYYIDDIIKEIKKGELYSRRRILVNKTRRMNENEYKYLLIR